MMARACKGMIVGDGWCRVQAIWCRARGSGAERRSWCRARLVQEARPSAGARGAEQGMLSRGRWFVQRIWASSGGEEEGSGERTRWLTGEKKGI
ncbi:hypothetical protein SLEP1_g51418 [Rubroshorea leprosula]|uniref:Uncharacterized protein n=1 Tax=Rubroshorea leprosula TaxID=152421 RepID=A0AAV5M4N2_9ROSI|nr:hypothetical protein SLEP1_g51418 [Rubroshorea leprosula]